MTAGQGAWRPLALLLVCLSGTTLAADPVFTNVATDGSTTATVLENAAVEDVIMTLTATDTDAGDTLTYSLVTVSAEFKVVGQELRVKAATLDYETTQSYVLTVRVNDGTTDVDGTVTVNVVNVNDETPVITSTSTTASVAESQNPGAAVTFAGLAATDADANDVSLGELLTYSLEGTDNTVFSIDSLTGVITTAQRLDRETTATYTQLVFKVSDAATPAHTATVSLTVSVTDINDVTPSCTPAVYYVTMAENTGAGTSLATLICSDTDEGVNGAFNPSIFSGDPGTVFAFSGLELQTGATATDYETTQSYTLIVHLVDTPASGTANTGTATVVVTVTGVNENNPAWGSWTPAAVFTSAAVNIAEDSAVGTSLFTIAATDNDLGSDGTITYSLDSVVDSTSATAVGVFRVDPVSGEVSTLQTLDRDAGITSYTVTVKADDGGGSPVTKAITVTLDDVNDNTPAFTSSSYSVTLAESAATAGVSLVQVAATDSDPSPTFVYSIDSVIVGNAASKFQFSGGTAGLLELASTLDLDTGDVAYTVIRILVTDGGSPIRTATATVTVSLTPTNDHTPVFGATVPATSPIALSESTATGTSVATVTATDQDAGNDGVITYSITGGNTNNAFTIIATSGEIRTQTSLDFEGTTNYNLEVTATDGGTTPKTQSATVSIDISNVNDNAPSCTNYYIAVTLAEDAAVNDAVTSLGCTDADGDTLTYTFTSGNGDNKFAIGVNSGAITLANTVDYDSATQFYTLQVSVTDGTNPQTVTIKVTLTPVNEATPSFASNPTQTVSESEAAGYAIVTYVATDSDYPPHGITTYAISAVTQSGGSKFTIDQSSGAISLLAPLDYEALPAGSKNYELTVTATDGGALIGTGTVTVVVQDSNDNSPTCTQSSWSQTVLESVSTFPYAVISSLGCTDAEDGTTLTYALTQSPGSLFSIASGGIQLGSAVDYETAASHTLTVIVSDAGTPTLSTTVVVNVIVQNVNDGPPAFSGTFDVSKAENVAIGTSVADVSAMDPDGAVSVLGNPQHSIISGDPSGRFNIDSSTGRVTTRAVLDAESTAKYTMVIKAVEQGGTGSATVTLTVTVTDVNDVTPSCNVNTFAQTVPESSAVGYVVLTLTCTDGDVTATVLTYSISSGDTTKFSMNGNALELAAALDYESGTTQYPLTVSVSDGTNTLDIVGSVTVGPVNESPPVFSLTTYPTTKSEGLAVGSTIVQVTATDDDSVNTADGVVTYAFVTPQTLFTIDSATGAIMLASSLDRETSGTHSILVTASDGATTVTATVALTVSDDNDNAPVFGAATYTATVSEADATGAAVVTVAATDVDDAATNGNGAVTYLSTIGGDVNGHFVIDVNTGAITTTTQLNADAIASYTLTVTATDRGGGSGALTSTAVVLVTVTGVNQYDPVFTQATYTATTAETTPVGTQLVQVSATDADTGSDGTVTYSMTTHAKFSLAADGWISVKTALDFETTPNSYTFDVLATDGGATPRVSTAAVTITVGDVNDNTALCAPSIITVQKREDVTGAVTTLSCTDADSGTNAALVYNVDSVNGVAGAGAFAVDTAGAVTVSALDYETDTSLAVVISVADQGTTPRTTLVSLTVTVTDVNENSPAFSGTPLTANVAESAAPGYAVITVAASDVDGSDVITYSLADTTYLEVDANSGAVTLKAPFNFETTPTYTVNVCAEDSNTVDAVKSTCETLTLTITDANDNDPVFSPSVYSANVDENAANGVTVTTVTATDADTLAAGGTVSYSLLSGNTDNVFRVDATAGQVIVDDNTFLDYERTTSFTLTVRAADGGGRSADAVVTVVVNPLNEATPTFTPASSTQTVAEDAATGSLITITAADTDSGSDGALTYSITAGASGVFSINPASGEVSLVAGLDRETTQQYTLTIQAVDGGVNPGAKTGVHTLTIDVTDVNDVTPSCSAAYYAASVSESAAVGTSVKDISCVDNDLDPAGLNNAVTYAITSGDAGGIFAVDAAGKVTVATASLDRETTPSYTLEVKVVDTATTGKLTATVTVQVTVTDENDNTPVFTGTPYAATVPEDSAIGFTALTVAATDADVGSNAAITYSLTSATPAGKFTVDPSTGDVTVTAALDFETDPSYTLVVTATDQGATPRVQTVTFTITIGDVDDNPPVCASSVYTVTLAEDANPATATVVTVSCPDADTAGVTYTLTDALFAVDSATGVVTLTAALDYETGQFHTLTITASDGTRTDTTTVQVTVTDVNEFDPVFDPTTPYTANLPEDSAVAVTVKDIGATDGDLSDTTLTFSITGGNTGSKFRIDAATGVIVLQGALDREATASYTLDLEVADGAGAGSRTATTSIVITVDDVNDNDPTCPQTAYAASVAEDATAVLTLACSDVDTLTPTVRYTLQAAGNTGTAFGIDANTGVLSVVGAIDYETLNSYNLVVEVDDKATPARTTAVPVTVTVTPVNEVAPAFPAGGYPNTDVIESTAVGTVVLTVAATDSDQGLLHGTVRYSIVSGNTQGDFLIDSSTGQISVARPLDREATASYTLGVRAADDVAGSASEKTGDVSVGITITDANDNYPVFNPASYTTTIMETANVTGTVLTVTVSDDDADANAAVTISIKSGNTGGAFSISGSDLILATALDYEVTQFYDLLIEAVDGGTPTPLTSQARISVLVQAVNEDAPVLTDANFSASIPEDQALGSLIYTAVATDADQGGNNDGSITYAITAGDTTPNSFIIDPNSGELRVFSQLDFDTPPQTYSLTVEARDGGGLTDTVTLTLTLTDVNDHTPQFSANTYTTTLDENVSIGFSVFTVAATDNDSGVNGQVTYTITGGNGQSSFAVNDTTGEVTTTAAIDYEATPILYLVVQAADGGATSLSSIALLRINVIDLNDNTPVVVPDDFTVTLSEDVAVGTQATIIASTDADSAAGNNNVVVYSLTSTHFLVDPATGRVTTKLALDREAAPGGYVLSVVATDQGTNPGQNAATATVTVALTDVNDNDPVITGTYSVTTAEDTAVGTVLFQITATDADIGDNGRLTYSITSGNTNNDLGIIASNGMVQVAQTLDREVTASYTLVVLVADNGTPTARSASVTATLTVSDVNDNDPVFTGTPYAMSVAENSVVGVLVGTLVATDADTDLNANLVYSVQKYWSGDNTHFALNAATGQLDTAVTTLDRETLDTYVIWCRVNDQGSPQRYADVNVTVTITDINDNPPVFSATTYAGSVAENTAVGTSVLSVAATDADIGANAAITFTIDASTTAGAKADTFLQVNSTSGEISVKANIDYETDTSFTFEVKATDGGTPAFIATATVTVTITDVNDNVPAFVSTFLNREVAYGGQCSNAVAQPVCQDADSNLNGQVACYLAASTYDYLFSVDGSTCEVTTQTIAAANTRYVVEIQCRDSGSPILTAATPATVRVDTFIPDKVIVKFQLGISRADFVAQQATFMTNMAALVKVTYPSALVRLWCIEERAGTASPASGTAGRRRLLQSAQPVDVTIYAVTDDTTESAANVDQTKTFIEADKLMAFFAADAAGTPSSAITGTAWDYYGIEKVTTYTEEGTPWIQTTEGIAVLVVSCVLAFLFLCLLIFLLVRCYRKRKRPVTPVRAVLVEPQDGLPNSPPNDTSKPQPTWLKNDTGGVPDLDKTNKAAVVGLPTAAIAATAFAAYSKKKQEEEEERLDARRKESVVTPRTILISTRDDNDVYPIANRDFDGRALDPTTGKVYEYNTRTHERRWLESPPGYNV